MDVAIPNLNANNNAGTTSRVAIAACMLAGMCTFLNVYDTQPLLPYLQRLYHTSEIAVSFTVSATILAVALTAPFIGLLAESVGRKKVIVPSLYALTVPTLLAATSQNLHQLIFWRFMQGIFVPGVIVVIMAYIGEEFGGAYVGRAMAAYITGTVLGGFGGRFISGMVAHHFDWRDAFVVIGLVNLAGAIMVQRWLPVAKNFVRAEKIASLPLACQESSVESAAVGGLRHGLRGAVLPGRNVHLCELLSRSAALSSQLRAAGQHLLRVLVWTDCDAALGSLP